MIENTQNNTPNPINPIIDIRENESHGSEFLLRKKKEEDKPQILLHKITHEQPGFFKRWGSFIDFLRHGREMENKKHLRSQHDVEDKLEVIKESPVLHITDENTEPQLTPSQYHHFYDNELVRDHITGQKNQNVVRKNNSIFPHQQTIYEVDNTYSHTTIDEITRQRQEDFWIDKEVKSYGLAGTTLALGITSLLVMPTIIALMVVGIAAGILYKLKKRACEATEEVYAWRNTVEENFRRRQEVGMKHTYDHNGASHLDKEVISKLIHPKEAWKFWQEEWKNFKEHLDKILQNHAFTEQTIHHFFNQNPYESYDKIASLLESKPQHHDQYEKLNGRYTHLQRAYKMLTYNNKQHTLDLKNYKLEETEKISKVKKGWTDRVDDAAKQLIGIEPNNIQKEKFEEHQAWSAKKEKVETIKKYYLEHVEEAFKPRKTKFDLWHLSREKSIEASANNTLHYLIRPVQAWWNLANLLDLGIVDEKFWKIDSVELGDNLKHDQPIDPPELPEPLPFGLVMIMPDKNTLEEKNLDPELTQAFIIKLF